MHKGSASFNYYLLYTIVLQRWPTCDGKPMSALLTPAQTT